MSSTRVLVVEDESLIAFHIESLLEDNGFEVFGSAATADQAMKLISDKLPDIGVLDINLGSGATSFPVAEYLVRKKRPILFLSGYSAALVRLPETFADAPRLAKPFNDRQFVETVKNLC